MPSEPPPSLTKEELVARVRRIDRRRKKAVQAYQGVTEELRALKAALNEHTLIVTTDASGRITHANDKFCTVSQYSREELLGQHQLLINPHHTSPEFTKTLWASVVAGTVWHGNFHNRAKDGTLYWVDATISPGMNAVGPPVHCLAMLHLITHRETDEAEPLQFASDLAKRHQELEQIVYSLAHDLSGPLLNIRGFSRNLIHACAQIRASCTTTPGGLLSAPELQQPLENTIPLALRFINAGVGRIEILLAGLLRYSRLGRVELSIRCLPMNELLDEVFAARKFQLDEAAAEVRVESLPDCLGDNAQTNQVFANLVDNALKYRDPVRPMCITVSGQRAGGQTVYAVADTGIGIAPVHHRKIFELFTRLNPNQTAGEGLGLTIAQRILDRQRGRIWVQSQPGHGSVFFVSLPAGPDTHNSDCWHDDRQGQLPGIDSP